MLSNALLVFLAIFAALTGLSTWAHIETNAYLRAVPEIKDAQHLNSFKRLAGRNMHGALVYLALLLPALASGIYAVVQQPVAAIAIIAIAMVLTNLVSKRLLAAEHKARSQPCATPELSAERDRIAQIWVHKAWPKFDAISS